ncbi:MAG TPA: Ger(x)C family spore germination protein [Bacillaceae bacterium]
MQNKWLLLSLASFLFLTGCVQQKVVDEVNMIMAGGIDYTKENKMEVTALFADYLPDRKIKNTTLTVSMRRDSEIMDYLDRESSRPVLMGDMDALLLGRKTVEGGIYPIVDTLQREADIPSRLQIAIVDGTAKEVLKGKYSSEGVGKYIYELIEHNSENRDVPRTNLHLFASDFYQKGNDAFLPIIKKVKGQNLQIAGVGVFKGDKLAHEIPIQKLYYFKMLVDNHTRGSTDVQMKKDSAVMNNIRTKSRIKADYDKLTVHIHFDVVGVVRRYTGERANEKVLNEIKKTLAKQIEEECLSLLKEFQDENVDPVSIERKMRQQNRNFDKKRWKDQYKEVKFSISTNIKITESGTVE